MVMAQIYIECGDYDSAFNELDYLLSLETWVTINTFKMGREWDKIRELPRYQELLKKYPYDPAAVAVSNN